MSDNKRGPQKYIVRRRTAKGQLAIFNRKRNSVKRIAGTIPFESKKLREALRFPGIRAIREVLHSTGINALRETHHSPGLERIHLLSGATQGAEAHFDQKENLPIEVRRGQQALQMLDDIKAEKARIAQRIREEMEAQKKAEITRKQQDLARRQTMAALSPEQWIFFGPPGTGKSHQVRNTHLARLGVGRDHVVETVFHPEYSHADFVGKLLPLSLPDDEGFTITYRFYAGHFLSALAMAYKEFIHCPEGVPRNVALVIDEINRGNCAAIFGSILQLFDRDDTGFSSYRLHLSEMEAGSIEQIVKPPTERGELSAEAWDLVEQLGQQVIRLPPNFSIFATMNTADETIFYMDSAFKRRWDWEYVAVDNRDGTDDLRGVVLHDDLTLGIPGVAGLSWLDFVDRVNAFVRRHGDFIRHIEDKQIGYRFIRPQEVGGLNVVPVSKIRNKLLFFLWDTVFPRHRPLLEDVLERKLRTFADLSNALSRFMEILLVPATQAETTDAGLLDTNA